MLEEKTEKPAKAGRRHAIVIAVVCVVAAALLAAGIGLGVHAHNERVAREAHERAVAAAQTRCDKSIDRLTAARGMLARQVRADRTQAALKLTDKQVADAKTLQALKEESTDGYSAASCKATSISVLDSHVKANQEASRKAVGQATRLTAAVAGVERSKAAKDEADRKAEEARKAEEQRKAQEAAAAAAAAQTQQQAQARQQSSRRNPGSANPSRPYRRPSTGYRAGRRPATPRVSKGVRRRASSRDASNPRSRSITGTSAAMPRHPSLAAARRTSTGATDRRA